MLFVADDCATDQRKHNLGHNATLSNKLKVIALDSFKSSYVQT